MRVLVVSDLHANWPALEAVLAAEPCDRLVVVGDLVSYGPHPVGVIDLVRTQAAAAVCGNHDDALARGTDCRCAPRNKPLAEATRAVHRTLLAPEQVQFLERLPLTASFEADGQTFFVVHASPRDALYSYALTPDLPDAELAAAVEDVAADCVLVGHTHLPMLRRIGSRVLINPGSVGQPRDGDPRASYAVIEDGVPRLGRVAYDVEATVRDLHGLRLDREITNRLIGIIRTGRT